ncbi:lipid II flippase MurJ [Kineococcus sp. NPDC059986]|uniref:murein biosynthesis integral membrane protein MurJ n=1 Tax=Kineococcus sp. NPDC059986 TaxID=3155538 RepID=UPI00344D3470
MTSLAEHPAEPTPVAGALTTGAPAAGPTLVRDRRARDATLVAGVMVLSSLLGLVRDLVIAALFGASASSDAFFVAWTIPETVTPLLNESGLALLLTPLFARTWAQEGSLTSAVRRTLLPVVVVTAAAGTVCALAAPLLVRLIAPGLADPAPAVACFRLASVTVLGLGVAGYLSSALRGRRSFVRPAATYVAYNVGILGCLLLEPWLGVRAAALGLAVGSLLMVAVVAPAVARSTRLDGLRWHAGAGLGPLLAVAPVIVYSLARQSQVFAERFFGSELVGAISELNYASKVAQIPVTLALVVSSVSLASVTAHVGAGRRDAVRREVTDALRLGVCLVLPVTVALEVLAPQITALLFQRGAFDAGLVRSTSEVLRWYSLGLPGQLAVGAAVLFLCIRPRGARVAAVAALGCLAVTVAVDAVAVGPLGAPGLALGNAAGITLAGVVLLHRLHRDLVALPWRRLADAVLRTGVAAAVAGAAAWGVTLLGTGSSVSLVAGTVFVGVHVLVAHAVGLAEVRALTDRLGARLGGSGHGPLPDDAPRLRPRWAPALAPVVVGAFVGALVATGVGLSRPVVHRATALVVVTTGADGRDATTTTQALTRLTATLSQRYEGGPEDVDVLLEGAPSSPVVQITVDGARPQEVRRVAAEVVRTLETVSRGQDWAVRDQTPTTGADVTVRDRVGPGLLVVGAGAGALLALAAAGLAGRWPGSAPHRPWPLSAARRPRPRRRRAAHRRIP